MQHPYQMVKNHGFNPVVYVIFLAGVLLHIHGLKQEIFQRFIADPFKTISHTPDDWEAL